MNKIEELENKMLEIAQEIAELKKGQNAGEWKPQNGDEIWFCDELNEPSWCNYDENYEDDRKLIKYTRIFKTKEECQKYCDYRKALIEKSYKFSEAEWENDSITKYFLYYSHNSYDWYIETQVCRKALGVVHFKTQEDAEYMIDNYSDEMLKWGLL